ncbi:MAG TPA: maleylpyruvate isomerase N-terminal domain-containing protein [Acidimicrobiia bacterium]|nr:maleylpyruvate isomerase N-terminal domain-containing protein [Acidimicrobiia bacterium]
MPTPSELVRDAFLGATAEARGLIASRAVAAQWREPSALPELTIGALAGHLARAAFVVVSYLDASPDADPEAATTTADQYFEAVLGAAAAAEGAMDAGIRVRAAEEAAAGRDALVERVDGTLLELDRRFGSEPAERAVQVALDIVMPLDEYLVTRMVELVVHSDDLATSVGLETPEFDAMTMACVVGCLLAMVRARHGDIAVVRGFARRERDVIEALRAF